MSIELNALEALEKQQQEEQAANEAAEIENKRLADEAAANDGGEGNNADDGEAERIKAEQAANEAAELEAKRIADEEVENKKKEEGTNEIDYTKIDYAKIDIDKALETKTAGKYKALKEIEEKLSAVPSKRVTNEFIEKYEKAIEAGMSHETFIKTQTTDYTKLDPIEKVKQGMMLNDPDLSREDVDVLVDDMYKLNPDKHDEETIKVSQTKLKVDAIKAEKALVAMQALVPDKDPSIEQKRIEKELSDLAEQEKQEKFDREWKEKVNTELNKSNELKVKYGEKDEDIFTYKLEKDHIGQIKEIAENPMKIFDLFKNEDGSANQAKLIEAVAILTRMGDINSKKAKAMEAKAIESYIKQKKNIDFNGGKNQRTELSNIEELKELAKQAR